MDFTGRRRSALLDAYRSERLQLDGLISCGSLLGLSDSELVRLLEDAAQGEPGDGRNERLALLLLRAFRRGRFTREQLISWAIDVGLEPDETARLLTRLGHREAIAA